MSIGRWTVPAVMAAMMAACGCAGRIPVNRPYPAPTVERLLLAWNHHQRGLASMNARARATSWLGGDRVRATVLMLVDRPGRLRFEAEISLQGTVAVLVTDGSRFGWLDLQRNELRRGPACPANVASLIRIRLGPAEVAAILLGDVLAPAGAGSAELPSSTITSGVAGGAATSAFVEWDPARGAEVLSVPRLNGWLRVVFQRASGADGGKAASDGWRILGADATTLDGKPRWRVRYEDFVVVTVPLPVEPGGGAVRLEVPQTIRFAEGISSFDEGVEIKFKQRDFNGPIDPSAFALEPAPGTSVVDVGCP